MKNCSKCGLTKPTGEFNADSSTIDGLRCYCRACGATYWAAYREKNREVLNFMGRARVAANPEKNRAIVRKSELKKKYGLTPESFSEMRKKQEDKCAICGDVFSSPFNTHVDHIHGSNPPIVRGLLCNFCNPGLGNFKNSIVRLEKAILYLKKSHS